MLDFSDRTRNDFSILTSGADQNIGFKNVFFDGGEIWNKQYGRVY